jgi:hypothetical protein
MGNRLTQLIVKTLRPVSNESGKVLGKTAARHTSQEFVEFLTEVVERAPVREVHIILDNLSPSSCAGIWGRPFRSSSGSRVRDCWWEA